MRDVKEYTHSVSVILVENMNLFERGHITKDQLLTLIDSLEQISINEQQRKFFGAYRKLVDKVENAAKGFEDASVG